MHRTKQGETWDMISLAIYGTPHRVAELISANPEHSDVIIFDECVDLIIPEIATATVSSLPPWKRG